MHSWVFRHRARLRVVFGVPEAPPPAANPARRPVRRFKPTHRRPRAGSTSPGTIDRREQDVLLRPMRRPAS